MNWEMVKGVVERVLLMAAMYLVGKGVITEGQATQYVALALGVISAVFGWYVNRPQSLLAATATIPAVEKVEMKPTQAGIKLAAEVTSSKVEVK